MPTTEQVEDLKWAIDSIGIRSPEYMRYRDYYLGNHPLMIDQERLRTIFGKLFKNFRLNLCTPVVDALTDRLQVLSFSAPSTDDASEEAYDLWQRNRMQRRAGSIHLEAVSTGDSYLVVWPEEQGVVMHPQKSHEVVVEYDPGTPGRITKAAKGWRELDGTFRINLYYEDRIEKYSAPKKQGAPKAGEFAAYEVEGEPWPLPNPYGKVPVFHFANNADIGEMGRSELTEAVPVQDMLNYLSFTLLVGAEFQAFRQRYAIGVEVPTDTDGNKVNPFKAGPDRVWIAGDSEGNAQFGEFQAGDLRQLDTVKKAAALDMAQVTQTPPHYFFSSTGLVSGESQKTAEQKLDAKLEDRQQAFGDTWAEVMALAVRMERQMFTDSLQLQVNWKDTKPRNHLEEWQKVGLKLDAGVSNDQVLREQGYTDEQINEFRRENRAGGLGQAPEVPATPGRLTLE